MTGSIAIGNIIIGLNTPQPKLHAQDSVGARVAGWMRGGPSWSPVGGDGLFVRWMRITPDLSASTAISYTGQITA